MNFLSPHHRPPIPIPISDFGSDVSSYSGGYPGVVPLYDPNDPYSTYRRSRRRRRHRYGTPSVISYAPSYQYQYQHQYPYQYAASYAPSMAYSTYSNGQYGVGGTVSERIYFSLDGKLVRSHKNRDYKSAQKLVLDLYPDLLQGIAASRIQFYATRPGYSSHGGLIGVKSYLSENAWAAELDTLAEHEIIGIEIRESLTLSENIASFFGGGGGKT
ncbi:hypothetical protein F5148DRAFT_694873 [Russula earlei]|uniref:Uncharacterized protein n=1 Tax=Russula earlei TaxID=71964 RepID=A0ACC0UDM6_9AGAM|nr:hypothetical protein F5148DRAFT_694873 [Russula earlei]